MRACCKNITVGGRKLEVSKSHQRSSIFQWNIDIFPLHNYPFYGEYLSLPVAWSDQFSQANENFVSCNENVKHEVSSSNSKHRRLRFKTCPIHSRETPVTSLQWLRKERRMTMLMQNSLRFNLSCSCFLNISFNSVFFSVSDRWAKWASL